MEKFIKRLSILVMLMFCVIIANAQNQEETYVVQSGETLYSISSKYGLTVEDLLNANKGITENVMAGQSIKIPAASSNPEIKQLSPCKTTHVVQKKETVLSIAEAYGLTEEDIYEANPFLKSKLKKGTEICIPYSRAEREAYAQTQQQVLQTIEQKRLESIVKYYDVIKIAVIAPFALHETRRSIEAQKITDFYKGFLLAVDSLKQQGVSCDIYAYEEIGNDGASLGTILSQPMLKHVNLIVGPFRPANVAKVARFARENEIIMVTPMSTKEYDITSYENIYEISAPQDFVLNHVYEKFLKTYSADNIVFVTMNDAKNNFQFVNGLKSQLEQHNITYKTIGIDEFTKMGEDFSPEKNNLIIPTSGSEKSLSTIMQKLRNLPSEVAEYKYSLFGYPEWQTYVNQKTNLHKYNATFYTTFYANPNNSDIRHFNSNFTSWFRRDQVKSFPAYGLLGYDIGRYFIKGIKEKGTAFTKHTPAMFDGFQTLFRFEKNADGAYLNNSTKFVRYNSDGSISVSK